VHRGPGVFFGPPCARFAERAEALREGDVELIDREEARRRLPQVTFVDSPQVLHDHTAGVSAAALGWMVPRFTARGPRGQARADLGARPRGAVAARRLDGGAFAAHRERWALAPPAPREG